ncbi:MAG: 4Fe-4S binding protein [Oscillospiraceae bacterium]
MSENNVPSNTENGGNIDEQGNVLWLDEERLKAKEQPDKALYKNHPNGLGIKNFLVSHVSARKWNWKAVLAVFRKIVAGSKVMKNDTTGSKVYKRAMMFTPEENTYSHGIIFNLNVDLSEKARSVIVPIDLVKEALKKAKFISGMDRCICRDGQDCKNYPKDIACLFLSTGGKVVEKHGMAREFTYEEACARVDRAASLGLVCQSLWVEIEQLIWGFKNDEMDHFIEICFCCPCCCVGLNLSKNASRDVKKRFTPSGFTAVADRSKCVGCGQCAEPCPQAAITYDENGIIKINQNYCVGCGICKTHCENDVIKIKQTMPMRKDMHEYFLKEGRLDLKMED